MITQKQRLEFCKVCNNRRVDYEKGLLCNLTGEVANFETECDNFSLDEERQKQKLINQHQMEHGGEINNSSDGSSEILWGAVWCIGGIVATVADFGYVFWGAIVFGGIQLVQGLMANGK